MSARKITALSLAVLMTVATVGPAMATVCFNFYSRCSATTSVVLYTDEPTIPCPAGTNVVEVTSSASCPTGGAGPAVALRCGAFNDYLTYSGNGKIHKVQPKTTWQDILNGNCRNLAYKWAFLP